MYGTRVPCVELLVYFPYNNNHAGELVRYVLRARQIKQPRRTGNIRIIRIIITTNDISV